MEYYNKDNVTTIPPNTDNEEDMHPEESDELSPFEEEDKKE